jgi:hypothetical protein
MTLTLDQANAIITGACAKDIALKLKAAERRGPRSGWASARFSAPGWLIEFASADRDGPGVQCLCAGTRGHSAGTAASLAYADE